MHQAAPRQAEIRFQNRVLGKRGSGIHDRIHPQDRKHDLGGYDKRPHCRMQGNEKNGPSGEVCAAAASQVRIEAKVAG